MNPTVTHTHLWQCYLLSNLQNHNQQKVMLGSQKRDPKPIKKM